MINAFVNIANIISLISNIAIPYLNIGITRIMVLYDDSSNYLINVMRLKKLRLFAHAHTNTNMYVT